MHSGMAKQDLQSSWDLQSGLEVLVEGVVLGGVEGLVGWAIVWYLKNTIQSKLSPKILILPQSQENQETSEHDDCWCCDRPEYWVHCTPNCWISLGLSRMMSFNFGSGKLADCTVETQQPVGLTTTTGTARYHCHYLPGTG